MAHTSPTSSIPRTERRHDQDQYLTFVLGKETFAIGILRIKEILEYEPPTDVPLMPAFIRGVVNLRGAVVPVIDLCARFGKPISAVNKRTCIVILEARTHGESHVLGVVVDSVNEVLGIPHTEIEPPPSFGAALRADFIEGMGRVGGKFVVLLDVDHVLSIDEMESMAVAGTPGARH